MNFKKSAIVASSLVFALSTHLFAQEVYTIQNKTLKEALEIISEKSNLSYLASDKLLEIKKTNNIKNVEGLENALEELFKGTGIKAVIRKDAIVIIEKTSKNNSNTDNSLGEVEILSSTSNITEDTGSYTVAFTNSATRMNLSLKDTPQSISVVTREKMNDLGLESIEDLVSATNGLYVDAFDSERMYFLSRGFSIENFQVDGIPTNIASGGYSNYQDLGMYDRVDVIRGAAGLLAGSGEPSATINYIRRKAKSKEFTGNASLEFGSWKKKKATIDVSSGLNEEGSIRGRVFTSKMSKESFQDFYERDELVVFGTLEADVSDNTLFTIGASYQKFDAVGSSYGSLPAFFDDKSETSFDRSSTIGAPWTGRESEQKRLFTTFNHYFNNDAKIIMSYTYGETKESNDLSWVYGTPNKNTGLGLSTWQGGTHEDLIKQHSFDLYSSLPFEMFNNEHELIAGVSTSQKRVSYQGTTYSNDTPTLGSFFDWKGPEAPKGVTIDDKRENKVNENAIYLANKFSFGKDLKIILGARLSNYKLTGDEIWGTDDIKNEHKNNLTPYFGFVYDLDKNHSVYASYTDIFKVQEERDKNNKFLEPKIGKSYETGVKASYFDNKLHAFASIFKTVQKNVAIEDGIIIGTVSDTAYRTAEGVTSKGFEAEVSGEVNDKLNLSLGISKFEAKEKNGKKYSIQEPRTKIKFNAKYKFDKLSLGAGLNWQSDMHYDYTEDGFSKRTQKAFFLANIMGKYDFTKNLSLQVNVNNLFDKTYYSSLNIYGVNYGAPRNFNFKLNYKF